MAGTVVDALDSGWLRAVAYVAVAGIAARCYLRERPVRRPDVWPTYWLLTALVLLVMGAARIGGLDDLVSELGRDQAHSGGWYETRRRVQVGAIGLVSVGWFVAVIVAVWRVPPRRRRYFPSILGLATIVAFAAIRLVSLHAVDTLLYRRDVGGIRIVTIVELSLLAASAAIAWSIGRRVPGRRPDPAGDVDRSAAAAPSSVEPLR